MKSRLCLILIPLVLANLFCTFSAPSPAQDAAPTQSVSAPVNTPAQALNMLPAMGSISGQDLRFPADRLPALRIVFYNLDYSVAAFIETAAGQNSYFIDLPAGTYKVVAYAIGSDGFTGGTAGGYTQAVTCGLNTGCNDHNLIPVIVKAGEILTGINPNDYYAPESYFPPMPK